MAKRVRQAAFEFTPHEICNALIRYLAAKGEDIPDDFHWAASLRLVDPFGHPGKYELALTEMERRGDAGASISESTPEPTRFGPLTIVWRLDLFWGAPAIRFTATSAVEYREDDVARLYDVGNFVTVDGIGFRVTRACGQGVRGKELGFVYDVESPNSRPFDLLDRVSRAGWQIEALGPEVTHRAEVLDS